MSATTKKSKEFYALFIKEKAQLPYIAYKLQSDFNLTNDQLRQIFQLPHSVTLESYVKAFQYKVLNSILYTNTNLHKMGFRTNDLCSFCKRQSESLNHLFSHCPYSKQFWNDLEIYWCSVSSKRIHLYLQNVLIGIIAVNGDPLHLLRNYFIMIGKVCLWNCKYNQIPPNIHGFRAKIAAKYETEKIICTVLCTIMQKETLTALETLCVQLISQVWWVRATLKAAGRPGKTYFLLR